MSQKSHMQDGHLVMDEADYQNPDILYNRLIKKIKGYHPSADISLIERAYKIAYDAHKDQYRKSGEAYIIHPLWVATILAELELDKESIIAGILHDVVEDTIMTFEEISEIFGMEVALLVDGVTKLGQLSYDADKLDVQGENLRKMFLAMAKDIRVILIKLADRLHNMRTLEFMRPEKQEEKAKETMDIYAPIAQRLGISKIKTELDDLSLRYLKPSTYDELVEQINQRKQGREEFVDKIVEDVKSCMESSDLSGEVYGRVKHLFSIYKKMVNQNKTVDEVYDLFAVRILVNDVKDCYAALGVIHENYTPIPGRFKDYIAMPKPNMYQSLHTTLIGKSGQPFEIQIRTHEMQKTAEYGIAAHWKYKGGSTEDKRVQEEEKLSWLRQILEWQQEMSDNKEFLNLLKGDLNLFADDVYCFTPGGDVKNLPKGSTPIDFAYAIHSAVGNKMVGARVNGKLVTIDHKLKNGDRIEIITSQNSRGPSRDWLNIVQSTQAKNKISQWFKKEFKEDNVTKGKEMCAVYAKAHNMVWTDLTKTEYQNIVMRKYGFNTWDAVMASIGHGGLKEGQVVNRLHEEYRKEKKYQVTDADILERVSDDNKKNTKAKNSKSKSGITVKGIDDVSVRFSRCCGPVPGDEVVGFVTRGRGLSLHRTDCINMIHLTEIERARLIEVEWEATDESEVKGEYPAELKMYVNDRQGILMDISKVVTELNKDIKSMNVRTSKQGVATIDIGFVVKGREDLALLIKKLNTVPGVIDIERTTG